MGPGLARQESAGRVCGQVRNRTDPFLRSKPQPLDGYPDPLLTVINEYIRSCPDCQWEMAAHRAHYGPCSYLS